MMDLKDRIYFVDVDDTLVRSYGSKRIPMTMSIDAVRALKERGATLYLWSSGGAEYCRQSAIELEIFELFTAFLPKPHVMIDDVRPESGRFLSVLHPNDLMGPAEENDDEED